MKVTYFEITDDSRLEQISAEVFVDQREQEKGLFWIDIQSTEPDEFELWLKSLGISDFAIELCVSPTRISAVIPLDEEVYFDFPVCLSQSEPELKENYVSFLCLQSIVIAIDIHSVAGSDLIIQAFRSEFKLAKTSTSAMLSTILASETFRTATIVDGLRESVFQLDESMDSDPDSVEAEDIRDQKRRLRSYDTVVNWQAACLKQLPALDMPFLSFAERPLYLQLATANAMSASQAVLKLDKTITDLSQRFDTNQQEKTNHRLAILTILSAIFMPLTFIAGIYGMNFEYIPELRPRWGYPMVLAVMFLIAGGMYRYFKTRGWLE